MKAPGLISALFLTLVIALPGVVVADVVPENTSASGSTGVPANSAAEVRVPAYLLQVPDSVGDILIADAATATMYRFVRSGDDLVLKDERYMSIGLNGTGKQRAWDRRTPLGVYFITESLDTRKLHEKYGVAAYPLDYPNAWDRQLARTGSGIWLHGVDRNNPNRPPLDTDGCLALPNDEISILATILQPLVTPVIVARELSWSTPDEVESLRVEFSLALDIWKESLAAGDLQAYLSLYAGDFQYRGMDKKEWATYRTGVFEAGQPGEVKLDDVMLVADPEEANLYLSRFTQTRTTEDGLVTTTKRLYWRREQDARWVIVAEDSA
jgi:murein L,D-transpeptidase YafK